MKFSQFKNLRTFICFQNIIAQLKMVVITVVKQLQPEHTSNLKTVKMHVELKSGKVRDKY